MSADGVARCVLQAYEALGVHDDGTWNVVAGIVSGTQDSNLRCVAVASGCKWWHPYRHDLVNDAHAEVLARRGAVAALWKDPSIATEQLHMYTSSPPCGDASIYTTVDGRVNFTGAKLFDWRREEHEQLVAVPRLKPGRSDVTYRTTSLSCTDKLIRWVLCGLEGSLHSYHLPHPVRLKTLTVAWDAAKTDQESVKMALDRTIARIADYAKVLGIQRPALIARFTQLAPSLSFRIGRHSNKAVVWWRGCGHHEIIVDGRLQGSSAKKPKRSRLCRDALFEAFQQLAPACPGALAQCKCDAPRSSAALNHLLRAYTPPALPSKKRPRLATTGTRRPLKTQRYCTIT